MRDYQARMVERVYPRVCGGTKRGGWGAAMIPGLSPRVRGNRGLGGQSGGAVGSIPACAGEPAATPPKPRVDRVYPRVCGGTPGALSGRVII